MSIRMRQFTIAIGAATTAVVLFMQASVVLAASDSVVPHATIGSRDVPRIALVRDASIKDFQVAKIPGNDGTTAAPFVGTFWDCSNVEDPDFDFCDLKLVFCPNPGEEGCWVVD